MEGRREGGKVTRKGRRKGRNKEGRRDIGK
jgi:hypothetical protein